MATMLPAAATVLAHLAAPTWQPPARLVLDDPLGTEAMLARAGVALEDASVIYGMASRRIHVDEEDERQDSVGWTTLDDRSVLAPAPSRVPRGEATCQHLGEAAPVTAPRRLRLIRGRPGAGDHRSTSGPEIILASTWDAGQGERQELGWVRLAPGDTVQQVTVESGGRRGNREVLELRTGRWGQLRLLRDGAGVEVCYDRSQTETLSTTVEETEERGHGLLGPG
jgi:hypothetical protein